MSRQFNRLLKTNSACMESVGGEVARMKEGYNKSLAGAFIGISCFGLYLSYKSTRSVLKCGKLIPVSKAPLVSIFGISYMAYISVRDSLDRKYCKELLNVIDIDEEVIDILNEENQVHVDEYRRHIFK